MPAAIARIIVSPTARETPRMYAAAIPDSAAGTTTLVAVCSRLAPIAYEPSRKLIGTARIASSLMELTYGTIMMPMTMPAESRLNPGKLGISTCSSGVRNSSAK